LWSILSVNINIYLRYYLSPKISTLNRKCYKFIVNMGIFKKNMSRAHVVTSYLFPLDFPYILANNLIRSLFGFSGKLPKRTQQNQSLLRSQPFRLAVFRDIWDLETRHKFFSREGKSPIYVFLFPQVHWTGLIFIP